MRVRRIPAVAALYKQTEYVLAYRGCYGINRGGVGRID